MARLSVVVAVQFGLIGVIWVLPSPLKKWAVESPNIGLGDDQEEVVGLRKWWGHWKSWVDCRLGE